jgi:hypothetical protein
MWVCSGPAVPGWSFIPLRYAAGITVGNHPAELRARCVVDCTVERGHIHVGVFRPSRPRLVVYLTAFCSGNWVDSKFETLIHRAAASPQALGAAGDSTGGSSTGQLSC